MQKSMSTMLTMLALSGAVLAGQFSPGMENFVQDRSGDDSIRALLALNERADIVSLNETLFDAKATLADRHDQVVTQLMNVAQSSQVELIDDLEDLQREGRLTSYTSFWLINGIAVEAPLATLRELARHPSVSMVEPDLPVELINPLQSADYKAKNGPMLDDRGIGITPGVTAIRADEVWYDLGITGVGALVANMDTGVEASHVSLTDRWRGNTEPASECWHDVLGSGASYPTDSGEHGTHVMGTITGVADDDSIGVCPGAQWIASNVIGGFGASFDSDVVASLQWFADPDGNPGTIDDVPDVVQNSWGVHEGFAGYVDCDTRWWVAIDNCEAAGVVLTWSAGNEGPSGTSLRSPADRATSPYNCFSVGSTSYTYPYTISSFSSRGPSGCGGAYSMKPEVCAPGDNIYSARPSGGYQNMSGTSMAGPHVAGVVGLMRSANPNVDVQTIKQVLMDTAVDLGSVGEDNVYGYGIIDAYAAVLAVMQGYGSLEGTVTNVGTGLPLAGVLVENTSGAQSATTAADGSYSMYLPEDSYTIEYSLFGFSSATESVSITEDMVTTQNVALTQVSSALLSGYVYDEATSLPLAGSTVSVTSHPVAPVLANGSGYYEIMLPVGNTYGMSASFAGYGADTWTVAFSGAQSHDFYLPELSIENFETGNFTLLDWQMSGDAPWFISTESYEGAYCAKSGDVDDYQSSIMSFELEVAATSDISFQYMVSSEASYDYLVFYIDGTSMGSWAGTHPWTEASYSVDPGTHTFTWAYEKDVSISTGGDCAWVDYIVLPASGTPEDHEAPIIAHTPLLNTMDAAGPWMVAATVTDASGLASVTMDYEFNGGGWISLAMDAAGNNYTAEIPGPVSVGTMISYRVNAVDASPFANPAIDGPHDFYIVLPGGFEYCQDFELGFDDFTTEHLVPAGSDWAITDVVGQGQVAHMQFSDPGQIDHARLISPVFDCSDQATVDLEFWHHLRMGWTDAWTDAYVLGSIDGGATWTVVIADWHANDEPNEIIVEGTENFSLTSWAAGESEVRLAFEFEDLYDWYWNVDDICLAGTLAPQNVDPPVVSIDLVAGNAVVSWDAVANATGYNVYSADDMGGAWTLLGSTANLFWSTTPAINEVALYRVLASTDVLRTETSFDPWKNRQAVVPTERK